MITFLKIGAYFKKCSAKVWDFTRFTLSKASKLLSMTFLLIIVFFANKQITIRKVLAFDTVAQKLRTDFLSLKKRQLIIIYL